jgi:pimeloyl-ACP methyl ester carboxylesterase
MTVVKFIIGFGLAFYLTILVAMYLLQGRMLFPTGAVRPPEFVPPHAERIVLKGRSGQQLHGLHIPPGRHMDRARPVILGFGGNAWHADGVAALLHDCFPESDVVAFQYRGYAPSSGRPSAASLFEDALLIEAWARRRFRDRDLVAVGFSVGSGVAAYLAARRPVAGLILVTPFDSLARVAADHYPWLPVRPLFRHEMRPARDLRQATIPIALIAAERDGIIPRERTAALRAAIGRPVLDRTIAGRGHNDLYGDPAFVEAMRDALAAVGGGDRPG